MVRYILVAIGVLSFSGTIFSQSCHGSASHTHDQSTKVNAVAAATAKSQLQTKCPVMGNDVDRSISAVWSGDENHTPKKVYFCCPGCIEKFNANPVKYIKKLEKTKQPIENVVIEKKAE